MWEKHGKKEYLNFKKKCFPHLDDQLRCGIAIRGKLCIKHFIQHVYALFVDYIVQDGSNMATFSHFKDWIDDTVFVFRDEDEHEHIISEVKVKIF